jgi:hypothetical protein
MFPSQQSQRIWRDHWCGRCWRTKEHGPGCEILSRLLAGVLPAELRPASRNVSEAEVLYRCEEFAKRPPVHRTPKARPEGMQLAMFYEPQRVDPADVDAARSITGLPREAFGLSIVSGTMDLANVGYLVGV